MRRAALISPAAWCLVAWCLTGCASNPMEPVRAAYLAGDLESAEQQLVALREAEPADAHVYGLELGVVRQALGDPRGAVAVMRQARDKLDELSQGNYTDWAKSVFLDDRFRAYQGADYEHVMVRVMLAIADLMDGGHDAYAYSLQVLEKQQEIIASFKPKAGKNPKRAYRLVPVGNYLRAILNEADVRARGVARREFEKVKELAPWFRPIDEDLERVTNGSFAKPGFGVVHVLAMVGRGPDRIEVKHRATRDVIAIAQAIWALQNDQPFVPNIVPLPIPALRFHPDNPERLAVAVDGRRAGETDVITDVEATAKIEFDALRPHVLARAVIRRLVKTGAVEAGKRVVRRNRKDDSIGRRAETDLIAIGIDVLGNLWAATEAADLRCWSLLPASFQVMRLELPAGDHEIELRAVRGGVTTGLPQRVRVQVVAGYNTFVSVFTPTVAGGSQPLASRPATTPPRN